MPPGQPPFSPYRTPLIRAGHDHASHYSLVGPPYRCYRSPMRYASLLLLVLTTGCATSPYLTDRARDAADIFTVSAGYGVGAKARVSCLNLGLLFDTEPVGLRGGGLYRQQNGDEVADFAALLFYGDSFVVTGPQADRNKTFVAPYFAFIPFFMAAPKPSDAYYWQIEAVAALGPAVRLGFNPGELLDFLLGWTTLDIFDDDIGLTTPPTLSPPPPAPSPHSVADPRSRAETAP